MKTILQCTTILALLLIGYSPLQAQDAKTATVEIKTSAECDMCKTRIEKAMNLTKGVSEATLDVKTRVLKVTYNPAKITPEKLRDIVSRTGYDADEVKARPAAYKRLPECCRTNAASGGTCTPK